jgi:hypothetical protein
MFRRLPPRCILAPALQRSTIATQTAVTHNAGKMPSLLRDGQSFGLPRGRLIPGSVARPILPPPRRALVLAMTAWLLASCGGKSEKRDAAVDPGLGDEAANSETVEETASKTRKGKKGEKKPGSAKGRHIGEIPLDAWPEVWFKQPLSVVAESASTVGPAALADGASDTKPRSGQSPAESDKAATSQEAAAKGGATDWASVIRGEDLADETKSIKNSLTPNLQDVGRYNSKYKDVQVDAATLAVMAGVAMDVRDAPSWKPNAKYIRDVSSQVAAESKANGEQFYRKAREAYDKLDSLLSGSKPPGLEESAENVRFSELAKRIYLMKRMNRGSNWMKTEVNTEALFKKLSGKVAHEGAILSLLGKVIATPDYADHDDPEYIKSAEAVSQSGRDIDEAVKREDFRAYTEALDRCLKACNKCHEVFKNG